MKKYSAVLITIVLALSFISVTAVAQPFGAGTPGAGKAFNGPARGGMYGGQAPMRGLMGLDLTDSQRNDIARIMDEYQAARLADCEVTREEMNAFQKDMKQLLKSFLDFFLNYGLELGSTSPMSELGELTSKIQGLQKDLEPDGEEGKVTIKWK